MKRAIVHMESNETGFTLDTAGNLLTIGVMLGRSIAGIEADLPELRKMAFRTAIEYGYKEGGKNNAETEAVAGCE